jgi:TonB family protein
VIVKAEVDENGRVIKAAIVETVHPMIDNMALTAVKSWVFQPKLCDGKPVSTTTRLEVHFR